MSSQNDNSTPIKNQISVGVYQHYKGGTYRLIGVAKDSNNLEKIVVYEALYDNPESKLWTRPLKEFVEKITWPDGIIRQRYNRISE